MGTSTSRPTYTQPTITTANKRLVNDADGTGVLTLHGFSAGAFDMIDPSFRRALSSPPSQSAALTVLYLFLPWQIRWFARLFGRTIASFG
jgi:hypothetical protein